MRSIVIAIVAYCITMSAQSACFAAEAADEAVAAAKAYFARLREGDVKQAVRDCWHTDALLSASFGLMYLELSDVERTRSEAAFADFVAAPFANKRLAELFKSIEVREAIPKAIDASTVAVQLQLEGDAGKFRAQNTLLLCKTGIGWRIVDQRQGDQPSIRVALGMIYMGSKKGKDDTIPVVLERAATETRKQMSSR